MFSQEAADARSHPPKILPGSPLMAGYPSKLARSAYRSDGSGKVPRLPDDKQPCDCHASTMNRLKHGVSAVPVKLAGKNISLKAVFHWAVLVGAVVFTATGCNMHMHM